MTELANRAERASKAAHAHAAILREQNPRHELLRFFNFHQDQWHNGRPKYKEPLPRLYEEFYERFWTGEGFWRIHGHEEAQATCWENLEAALKEAVCTQRLYMAEVSYSTSAPDHLRGKDRTIRITAKNDVDARRLTKERCGQTKIPHALFRVLQISLEDE